MDLPTIAFSIADDVYLPERTEDGVKLPAEKFAPEFGGGFVLKWPTLADTGLINGRYTAYWQAQGVSDPSGVGITVSQLIYAIFFFDVLATQKPAWVSESTKDTPKFRRAMMRALVRAQELTAEEKKTSGADGASTLQPS